MQQLNCSQRVQRVLRVWCVLLLSLHSADHARQPGRDCEPGTPQRELPEADAAGDIALLPSCSAGNPLLKAPGEERGKEPRLRGSRAAPALRKCGKQAWAGGETALLKHAQSAQPRGCERDSVPHPVPELSPGLHGACVLRSASGKLQHHLGPPAGGHRVAHAAVHLSFSVRAAGSERDRLSPLPALSLAGLSMPSANRWISAQASSRYWDERIHRKNRPRSEGGCVVLQLCRSPGRRAHSGAAFPRPAHLGAADGFPACWTQLTLPELDALGLDGGPDDQGVVRVEGVEILLLLPWLVQPGPQGVRALLHLTQAPTGESGRVSVPARAGGAGFEPGCAREGSTLPCLAVWTQGLPQGHGGDRGVSAQGQRCPHLRPTRLSFSLLQRKVP